MNTAQYNTISIKHLSGGRSFHGMGAADMSHPPSPSTSGQQPPSKITVLHTNEVQQKVDACWCPVSSPPSQGRAHTMCHYTTTTVGPPPQGVFVLPLLPATHCSVTCSWSNWTMSVRSCWCLEEPRIFAHAHARRAPLPGGRRYIISPPQPRQPVPCMCARAGVQIARYWQCDLNCDPTAAAKQSQADRNTGARRDCAKH
jgi:hypothetical protein